MIFFDATVTPSGLVQTLRQHESEQLVSKAVNFSDACSTVTVPSSRGSSRSDAGST